MVDDWNPEFYRLSPLFAPLRAATSHFVKSITWPDLTAFNAMARSLCLRNAEGLDLVFVAATPKPRGSRRRQVAHLVQPPYEVRIFQTGEVPTRLQNWHDFFNALVWATYPQSKAALNQRQNIIATAERSRGREQDRLAMFDEGGIIERPSKHGQSSALVFGHALFESFMNQHTDVFGMTYTTTTSALPDEGITMETLASIDTDLASHIRQGKLWTPDQRPPRSLLSKLKFANIIE